MNLAHFTTAELACPLTSEIRLATGFGAALEALRMDYGHPMPLTSCCRSLAHNGRIGGHPRSLHLMDNEAHETDTCAVDVALTNSGRRAALVGLALAANWSVGVASNFLHLDRRTQYTGLPQVLFHYKK